MRESTAWPPMPTPVATNVTATKNVPAPNRTEPNTHRLVAKLDTRHTRHTTRHTIVASEAEEGSEPMVSNLPWPYGYWALCGSCGVVDHGQGDGKTVM
jgi:hypothetical protein